MFSNSANKIITGSGVIETLVSEDSEIVTNLTPSFIVKSEEKIESFTASEILKIFKKLAKEENKCIIIVTHSLNVCDKVDVVYELGNKK